MAGVCAGDPEAGGRPAVTVSAPAPVCHTQPQGQNMADEWPLRSYLELGALPGAVPCARLACQAGAVGVAAARIPGRDCRFRRGALPGLDAWQERELGAQPAGCGRPGRAAPWPSRERAPRGKLTPASAPRSCGATFRSHQAPGLTSRSTGGRRWQSPGGSLATTPCSASAPMQPDIRAATPRGCNRRQDAKACLRPEGDPTAPSRSVTSVRRA